SDLDKDVIKSYGKWGKRNFRGKEYMGVARSTFLINPNGTIAHVWSKVSVGRHPKEVQKILVELKN
ncbi:MAG: peroxiredoxin, partial [Promethearchaeota archaeon]